jgi:hypothetical protein
MRLLNGLFDYSIFAKSEDTELIQFCNYFVAHKGTNKWNESTLQSICNNIQGTVIGNLSITHLINTINYMRHWIYLPNICNIIMTFRDYSHIKIIESKVGGSIIIKDFKKVDFSIDGRINTIISLLEDSI